MTECIVPEPAQAMQAGFLFPLSSFPQRCRAPSLPPSLLLRRPAPRRGKAFGRWPRACAGSVANATSLSWEPQTPGNQHSSARSSSERGPAAGMGRWDWGRAQDQHLHGLPRVAGWPTAAVAPRQCAPCAASPTHRVILQSPWVSPFPHSTSPTHMTPPAPRACHAGRWATRRAPRLIPGPCTPSADCRWPRACPAPRWTSSASRCVAFPLPLLL